MNESMEKRVGVVVSAAVFNPLKSRRFRGERAE
jgi:hypothetical protein